MKAKHHISGGGTAPVNLGECRGRCEWARQHLKTLREAERQFLSSDPYQLVEEFDRETGRYSIRIVAGAVPPAISFLAGDVLHSLRSSLDHLVWQLTVANGNAPPPFPLPKRSQWRYVQFPISLTEDQYKGQQRDPTRNPLWGVSEESRTFIRSWQPFIAGQDARGSALWVLQELSNIDKHRVPHVAVSWLTYFKAVSGPIAKGRKIGGHLTLMADIPGVFEHDTEVFTLILDPIPEFAGETEAEVELEIAFHERSGIGRGLPVVRTLGQIGEQVHNLLAEAEDSLKRSSGRSAPLAGEEAT